MKPEPPGRPRAEVPEHVLVKLVGLRCTGMNYAQVAEAMNSACVPVPTGCDRWHTSYV